MRAFDRWLPMLVVFVASGSAIAAEIGDRDEGRRIANRWCAECHDITGTMPRLTDGPPSFLTIANRTDTTAAGLRAFLHTPHGKMPDLALTRSEIDHLLAYLLSMRRP
jgi:mono/diheme cytochrome c family protein